MGRQVWRSCEGIWGRPGRVLRPWLVSAKCAL